MKNMKRNFLICLTIILSAAFAELGPQANGQARRVGTGFTRDSAIQQPLYSEYKGVRLGMTAEEARAKLGTPAMKDSDQDYYIFSDSETAQIVYDASEKVITLSVDYVAGLGAPDAKAVVGGELEQTPNGNLYKIVYYQSQGFWVSYNRTAGPVVMVTITIQKIR